MLLPRFNYHEPKSLAEAAEIMDACQAKARILAGGTDLLVNLKKGAVSLEEVVYLGRVPGLAAIDYVDGDIKIGPMVTAAALVRAASNLDPAAALVEAAGRLGSPLVRNRATLGGNVVTARPAADTAPPLMALDARLTLTSKEKERQVSINEVFTGPGQTVLEPSEILSAITIPDLGPGCGSAYLKLGSRRSLEISIVNVAAFLQMDQDGTVKTARLVMGAVGPTPLRAKIAEGLIEGERPKGINDPIFVGASMVAVDEASPIDDHRGSAEYRKMMIEVLTKRALGQAWLNAKGM